MYGKVLAEIRAQLESWFAANPFHRGINWSSALEVSFRALSWMWVYHLVGEKLPAELRARVPEVYRQVAAELADRRRGLIHGP